MSLLVRNPEDRFSHDAAHLVLNRFLADGTPILDMVQLKTEVVGIDIHEPYEDSELKVTILTKSYIWWTDDPWAALVALAGISILLCIVGIIVLVFTHSRLVS